MIKSILIFFFSSRRRHTRWPRDWSSDVCSSDLLAALIDVLGAQVHQDLGDVDLHRAHVVAGPAQARGVGERGVGIVGQIGRASGRERGWRAEVGVGLKGRRGCDDKKEEGAMEKG